MKHKFIIALIILALTYTASGGFGEESSSWLEIVNERPLVLDTYELPVFLFKTADNVPHKASITVTLAYAGTPELQRELEQKKADIRNDISILLNGKKYEHLDSFEDVIVLSDEIKSRVNAHLTSGRIAEVYFWDFVLD